MSKRQIVAHNRRDCTYVGVRVGEDFPIEPGKLGTSDSIGEALEVGVASRDRKWSAARAVVVLCVVVAGAPTGCD